MEDFSYTGISTSSLHIIPCMTIVLKGVQAFLVNMYLHYIYHPTLMEVINADFMSTVINHGSAYFFLCHTEMNENQRLPGRLEKYMIHS